MESAAILPFTAKKAHTPNITFVNQSKNAAGWTTAIGRSWPKGSSYCGLCPLSLCNLTDGFCLVTAQVYVSDDDAPTFSLADHIGLPTTDDLGPGRRCGG